METNKLEIELDEISEVINIIETKPHYVENYAQINIYRECEKQHLMETIPKLELNYYLNRIPEIEVKIYELKLLGKLKGIDEFETELTFSTNIKTEINTIIGLLQDYDIKIWGMIYNTNPNKKYKLTTNEEE